MSSSIAERATTPSGSSPATVDALAASFGPGHRDPDGRTGSALSQIAPSA